MRVLVTSVAGIGHVHPLIPLAVALQAHGHDVLWATGPEVLARIHAAGLRAVPAGLEFDAARAELRRRYPEMAGIAPHELAAFVFPRFFGEVLAEAMLDDVARIARDVRPDLVLHEAGEFAAPIVAASLGAPNVTHGFGALTPRERVAQAGERAAPLWRVAGLEPRPYGGCYDHLYLDPYPAALQPTPGDHVPHRQPVRPVPFDAAGDGDAFDPPPGDAPLVYLTLGTVHNQPAPLRTAVEGIASLPVRVVVTVGPSGDPAALGPQPANVRVARYVPQTQVLPRCAAIASHAGSGTFLAALAHGVPQLCLPQAADQFLNAEGCRRSGAGLVLTPEQATPDTIRDAMRRLLDDVSFREAAERAATDIAAMPSPGDVVPVLERLSSRR